MALLTEKQLMELANICIKSQDSNQLINSIKTWNEKQEPVYFFEPDWDKSPTDAKKASLELHWIDSNGNKFACDVVEQFDKPITPHPHAKLILKYAEVAARRCDPWVEFEWTSEEASYVWRKHNCSPIFKETNQYRYIGDE